MKSHHILKKNLIYLIFLLKKKKIYKNLKVKIKTLEDYMNLNNIDKISFLKIDTEGYEYEILKGLKKKIQLVDMIMFEHHYDQMIIKNYKFREINDYLTKLNFKKIIKFKMPLRKTFEYIYVKKS